MKYEPLLQIFRSRTRRRIGAFFALFILLSGIIDLVDGIGHSDLAVFWSVAGFGGGGLFLGANLLRFLPDDPAYRWQYGWAGILFIFGGTMVLVFGLASIWLY